MQLRVHFLQCTIKINIFFKISPIQINTDAIQAQVADLQKSYKNTPISTYVWYYPFTFGSKKLET